MNQVQFEAAKKRFESYDLRVKNNELSVEAAYDAVIAEKVRAESWVTYRQALRDLPTSAGFPHNVEWPVEPS